MKKHQITIYLIRRTALLSADCKIPPDYDIFDQANQGTSCTPSYSNLFWKYIFLFKTTAVKFIEHIVVFID